MNLKESKSVLQNAILGAVTAAMCAIMIAGIVYILKADTKPKTYETQKKEIEQVKKIITHPDKIDEFFRDLPQPGPHEKG